MDTAEIRSKLPKDFEAWRRPPGHAKNTFEPGESIWRTLSDFFGTKGYTLWSNLYWAHLVAPDTTIVPTGYMYSMHHRGFENQGPGSMAEILQYQYRNPLTRAARTADGRDVIIRVLAMGDVGQDHIEILNEISRGSLPLLHFSHTLPLLDCIQLEDITFGVFPKAGGSVDLLFYWWAKPSAGDIVDVIIQCLEALYFLHASYFAHRDVALDNFLIQWIPENLEYDHIPASRPRVYINDFELAVGFNENTPEEDHLCVGIPLGGSIDRNARPMPPEVLSGKPYSPYKLDVWQLGVAFEHFRTGIQGIDSTLDTLSDPDPSTRPTAYRAMTSLLNAVTEIPPKLLRVPPVLKPRDLPPFLCEPEIAVTSDVKVA